MNELISKIKSHFVQKPALWLVISLILMILVPLPAGIWPGFRTQILGLFLSFVVVTGLITINKSIYHFTITLTLGTLAVVLLWFSLLFETSYALKLSRTLVLLGLSLYIGKNLFDLVFKSKKVNKNIIYTSVAGYMLIGIIGSQACYLLELCNTGSFEHHGQNLFYDYQYFSFVTLTTLGYGDIIPVTPRAKAITLLISLVGQLYLTVIIAILVGKYIARSHPK